MLFSPLIEYSLSHPFYREGSLFQTKKNMNSLAVDRDLQNVSAGSSNRRLSDLGGHDDINRSKCESSTYDISSESADNGANNLHIQPQTLFDHDCVADSQAKAQTQTQSQTQTETETQTHCREAKILACSRNKETVEGCTDEHFLAERVDSALGGVAHEHSKRKFKTQGGGYSGMPVSLLQKQCLGYNETLESVSSKESGIMHHIASFLNPMDCTTMAQTSLTLCKALRGCFIRLDWNTRPLTRSELQRHFGACSRPGRLTSWKVTGASVQADDSKACVWSALQVADLRKLFLVWSWDSFDVLPIDACKKLDCFDAGVSCTSMPNLDKLKHCTQLEYLYIRCCRDVRAVADFLPASRLLKELSLYMCKNLRVVDGLNTCVGLKILDLGGCASLVSVAALAGCRQLEQLSLADCSRLESIDCLRGHSRINHLDITGCAQLHSLRVLETLQGLAYVAMARCASMALFPLLSSNQTLLATKATEGLAKASLWALEPVLADVIRLFSATNNRRTQEHAAEVVAAAAAQENGGNSALLELGVLAPCCAAMRMGAGNTRTREFALATIARLCHNRRSVNSIGSEEVVTLLVAECEMKDPGIDHACAEHAASALLLIALVEEKRMGIVRCGGVEALVALLAGGSNGAAVEAAGALWNLGATLEIGRLIVECGAVPVLIEALRDRPIAAKVQAAGALRNLAILSENKNRLSEGGIVEVLIDLIAPSKLDVDNEEHLGLLIKVVATLRILSSDPAIQLKAAALCAVPPLCKLLNASNEPLRRQASGALLALSFHEANRAAIADAKPIPTLIRLVAHERSDAVVMSAAGCLWNLAMNDDLERKIVACNAIPPLISRLTSQNIEVVCKAAGALKNLSYQRNHKEIVSSSGGIVKLVELMKKGHPRVLPYAVGALRLVASGRPETRRRIVEAGAIKHLVELLSLPNKKNDAVRLASGTLLHLADMHTQAMVQAGAVPHLVATMNMASTPSLVREEAKYILHRITYSPNNSSDLMALEEVSAQMRRCRGDIVVKRVRGIPGDTCITEQNTVRFMSYSSVATETYVDRGKCYYEVEILSVKGFPTFGWVSRDFEVGINHLFDCGVGFPREDDVSHDSWAIDGVNQRKWPSKVAFGHAWKVGDVVTIAADLDSGKLAFGLNGDFSAPMGAAFENIFERRPRFALSPALSGSHNTQVRINFGERPFKFPPPSNDYLPVSFRHAS